MMSVPYNIVMDLNYVMNMPPVTLLADVSSSDWQGAVAVLQGLTKVKRFSLTLLLITSVEKQGLETIFDWLAFASDAPSSEVQELRSLYCIT
jgi:hypothetical protein